MERLLLQVMLPEDVKLDLAVAAARGRTTQAALVARALRAAGYGPPTAPEELPHVRNARLRRDAVEGEEAQP